MTINEQKHQCYLKLECDESNPRSKIGYLQRITTEIARERQHFGAFSEQVLCSDKYGWVVVKFIPYSRDLDSGMDFKTSFDATNAAINHLSKNKRVEATPFDLEGMISELTKK